MITFIICLILLVLGYVVYGKFIEHLFGPDDRETPAVRLNDGVDYIVMPGWKIFMIQFLNIAGTGPIFGAIMGMWYGPTAYVWIVFGCIFAGAVHDYLAGMVSIRKNGAGLPNIVGEYLGPVAKVAMLTFAVGLLILVGAVFVLSPATLINDMVHVEGTSLLFWILVIFGYYVIATMMPVDKIIGKIYPLFAFSLIFMALSLMVVLVYKWPSLPEIWEGGFRNLGVERLGVTNPDPMFPALFVTIACGAISGFHATQSPMMARCMKSEKLGRPVFYGSMITEGIVALVWATISSWFFYAEGWREVCSPEMLAQFTGQSEKTVTQFFTAPRVVMQVCEGWLGVAGGMLAILGVIAAPITSGDTAMRSVRLIIAENLHIDQRPIIKRLLVSAPIFLIAVALLVWQMDNPDSFNVIWKYFGWANQTLAVFTLWALTVYLALKRKLFVVTLIPALFMTGVSVSFLLNSKQSMGLPIELANTISFIVMVALYIWFCVWHHNKFDLNYKNENKKPQ